MERKIENAKDLSPTQVMENYWKDRVKIPHRLLKRFGDSVHKSECPICEDGLLVMRRDPVTLNLMPDDNCTLCGTRFYYDDIEEGVTLKYKTDDKENKVNNDESHESGGIHIGWVFAALAFIAATIAIFL